LSRRRGGVGKFIDVHLHYRRGATAETRRRKEEKEKCLLMCKKIGGERKCYQQYGHIGGGGAKKFGRGEKKCALFGVKGRRKNGPRMGP